MNLCKGARVRSQNTTKLLSSWGSAYPHNQMFRAAAGIPLAAREGARRGEESHLLVGGVLREGVLAGERDERISASKCGFLTPQTIKTLTWTFAQAQANFSECSLTKTLSPALIMATCRAATLIHLSVSCGRSLPCSSCSLHSLPC